MLILHRMFALERPFTLDQSASSRCTGTGKLESMRGCSADVIGLDWAVDIADARAALGQQRTIQVLLAGNLFKAEG